MAWRVGRKVGRTIYDGDTLIGVMDTPELAAVVVEAVNRRTAPLAAPRVAGPPTGKMCTHGRPFLWYGPDETITCQHCCLELGEQCPTCRGEGRVPAATPGPAPTPPSEPDAMPSLINQLMMGADAWMQLANQLLPGLTPAQGQAVYEERALRATQYRERAERIRYWTARAKAFRDNPNVPLSDMSGPMVVSMLEIICGEIPADASRSTGPVPCCNDGAKLAEDWVARYKCPTHGWQEWKPIPGESGGPPIDGKHG